MTTTDDALAAMVASTKERKEQAAAKLTPVVGEREAALAPAADDRDCVGLTPPQPPALTKADLEELVLAIDDSRDSAIRYHDRLRSAVGGVLAKLSAIPVPVLDESAALADMGVDIVAAAKRVFPDATFVEGFAAKTESAKASFFKPQSGSPVEGWVCPAHGDASIESRTTLKGMKFRACTACKQKELSK